MTELDDLRAQLAQVTRELDEAREDARGEEEAAWVWQLRAESAEARAKEAGAAFGHAVQVHRELMEERDAANEQLANRLKLCDQLTQERDAARAELAKAREALRLIQYGSCDGCGNFENCPKCGWLNPEVFAGEKRAGHAPDCPVAAALSTTRDDAAGGGAK